MKLVAKNRHFTAIFTFHTNVGAAHKSKEVLDENPTDYNKYKADWLMNHGGQRNTSPDPKITAPYHHSLNLKTLPPLPLKKCAEFTQPQQICWRKKTQ